MLPIFSVLFQIFWASSHTLVITVITASMAVRNSSNMLPLSRTVPQFDISFPEKFLKFVSTRGEIFSLKFTKYRLAAGLRPDPLGELKHSPDP